MILLASRFLLAALAPGVDGAFLATSATDEDR